MVQEFGWRGKQLDVQAHGFYEVLDGATNGGIIVDDINDSGGLNHSAPS